VGAALGYGIGAVLGDAFGWREAFFGIGIPGLFVALSVLTINDPRHGINDPAPTRGRRNRLSQVPSQDHSQGQGNGGKGGRDAEAGGLELGASQAATKSTTGGGQTRQQQRQQQQHLQQLQQQAPSLALAQALLQAWVADVKIILRNKAFLITLVSQIASNFALGGLADWMSTFLIRYHGASVSSAGLVVGAATIVGGIGGNILGAKVADFYRPKWKSAYFLVPGLFVGPATVCMLLVINIEHNLGAVLVLLFLGNVLTWTYTAPISQVSISVIPPRLRAQSCGVLIFFQHILGDIISPPIIGAISDGTGSLRNGMQVTWIALALSGVVFLFGYWALPPLDHYVRLAQLGEGEGDGQGSGSESESESESEGGGDGGEGEGEGEREREGAGAGAGAGGVGYGDGANGSGTEGGSGGMGVSPREHGGRGAGGEGEGDEGSIDSSSSPIYGTAKRQRDVASHGKGKDKGKGRGRDKGRSQGQGKGQDVTGSAPWAGGDAVTADASGPNTDTIPAPSFSQQHQQQPTYSALLCGDSDPLVLVDGVIVPRPRP